MTALPSCTVDGEVLPVQDIFEGKTAESLPKGIHSHHIRIHGWNLSFTPHWSSLGSMQDCIRSIFVPCVQMVCKEVDYVRQHFVLIINCYSVHRS